MNVWFGVLAGITIAGALAAMGMRNLVHCALALAVAFTGIGTLYLSLGAQFLGLAQLLVYVGAVAVLIVFVILLTRGPEDGTSAQTIANTLAGILVAGAVFAILALATLRSRLLLSTGGTSPIPVRQLGMELMDHYILPLEVIALMLTAALIGAVIVAMKEKRNAQ